MQKILFPLLVSVLCTASVSRGAGQIDLQAAARAYAKAGGDVKALAAAKAGEVAELKAVAQAYAKVATEGDMGAVLATLPDSYREALRDVAKSFAGKMDKDLWLQGRKLVHKVSLIAVRQNDFLLSSEAVSGVAEKLSSDVATRRANSIRLFAKLAAVAKASSLESLKQGKLEEILSVAPIVVPGVTDQLPPAKMPSVKLSPRTDGTVAVSFDGKELVFAKVEGRWMPKDTKAFFEDPADGLAEIRKAVDELSFDAQSTAQMKALLQSVNAGLDTVAKAETKESFDAALQQLMVSALMGAALFQEGAAAPF